jgi:peptidoglycan/LPS O-acetylase OafA/YrhL
VSAQSAPGLPPPENNLYYPALDGLRAIAVFLVFTDHYLGLPQAINWGWCGVDIFFVLSGFLITGILYDSRNRRHRFRIFYIRRTLRIFPLYYFVLLVCVLLYPIFRWQLHPALWLWPLYLGNYVRLIWSGDYPGAIPFLDLVSRLHFSMGFNLNLDHLWSLCVEEQFYLVWPLVVFLIKDRVRLRNLCLVVVVAMPLIRMLVLHLSPQRLIGIGLLYTAMPFRADALLLGGALALSLRGPEASRLKALAKPTAQALLALFAALEVVHRLRHGYFIDPNYGVLYNPFGYSLIALIAGAVILLALDPGSIVYRACMFGKLRALGQRSYGFYVYHLLLYWVFAYLALALCLGHKAYLDKATALVALVGTTVIAWLSFRFLEAPLLRLKDRFAGHPAAPAPLPGTELLK